MAKNKFSKQCWFSKQRINPIENFTGGVRARQTPRKRRKPLHKVAISSLTLLQPAKTTHIYKGKIPQVRKYYHKTRLQVAGVKNFFLSAEERISSECAT
jgi:hypothetical protein